MDFKVGDEVICIQPTGVFPRFNLSPNRVYIVTKVGPGFLRLKNNDFYFKKDRFILATKIAKILYGGNNE